MNIVLQEKPNNNSRVYGTSGSTQIIDVVNEMSWTLSNKNSRKDAPRMRLVEYQQSTGQLIAACIYFSKVLKDFNFESFTNNTIANKSDPIEVYKLKYFGEKTGFEYSIPYFNPKNLSRTNSFGGDENPFASFIEFAGQTKSSVLAGGGTSTGLTKTLAAAGTLFPLLGAAKNVINSAIQGQINFEFPKGWENTSPETYSTTFDLINTTNTDDVINNWKFCHLLSYQNSPSRRNFAIMDPPVIYSMSIPGIVDLPVCYMNDLQITNLGNTRIVQLEGVARIVPEAYRITISLTSLLLPSRNIMAATRDGKTVEVISDIKPYERKVNELRRQLFQSPDKPKPDPQSELTEKQKNEKFKRDVQKFLEDEKKIDKLRANNTPFPKYISSTPPTDVSSSWKSQELRELLTPAPSPNINR